MKLGLKTCYLADTIIKWAEKTSLIVDCFNISLYMICRNFSVICSDKTSPILGSCLHETIFGLFG